MRNDGGAVWVGIDIWVLISLGSFESVKSHRYKLFVQELVE